MVSNLNTATSVDVECTFSHSQLLLPHVHNHLSAQSTRALLCLGSWSLIGLIKDSDVTSVAMMEDVDGNDQELKEGWDKILVR